MASWASLFVGLQHGAGIFADHLTSNEYGKSGKVCQDDFFG